MWSGPFYCFFGRNGTQPMSFHSLTHSGSPSLFLLLLFPLPHSSIPYFPFPIPILTAVFSLPHSDIRVRNYKKNDWVPCPHSSTLSLPLFPIHSSLFPFPILEFPPCFPFPIPIHSGGNFPFPIPSLSPFLSFPTTLPHSFTWSTRGRVVFHNRSKHQKHYAVPETE